jgi:hypothetical protein
LVIYVNKFIILDLLHFEIAVRGNASELNKEGVRLTLEVQLLLNQHFCNILVLVNCNNRDTHKNTMDRKVIGK